MRVIFVITGLSMGGAENQVVSLADKLAEKEIDVTIAYMLNLKVVVPKNKHVKLVYLKGERSPIGVIRAFVNLVRLIRESRPDVVHSHMYHANILSRVARLFAPIENLVSTAHSNKVGGRVRVASYRLTNRLCDTFTNVSDDAVRRFEEKRAVPKGRMLSVKNGIDVDRFKYSVSARRSLRKCLSLNDKMVFISIGRFHESKDYPNLIESFSSLLDRLDNSHLLIVGDGALRSDVEIKIKQLGLQESVTLLGLREDIPQLLSAADVYVMSSAWEGLPLVIAEAMAVQRVVVATNCGGTGQIIGGAGYIVPPKNSAALADAMFSAASLSADDARELGRKARERIVGQFSLDATVDKWLEIYGS